MTAKAKDQLILEAAFAVFSSKGFHSAKVEEIAKKAGVGKGTIYEYFKSKAHLFHEMFKWHLERYFAEVEKGLDNKNSAVDKIYLIVKNHIIFSQQFKSLAGKLLNESHPQVDVDKDFKQTMVATYKEKIQIIKGILEEGIRQGELREMDTDLIAVYLFGSLGGLIRSLVILDEDLEPDAVAQKVVDVLLKGMKQ